MILYHGSNVIVKEPKIIDSDRKLDFGKGFYLTTDYEQARKWALRTYERRKLGNASISVFEIEENTIKLLKVKKFKTADKFWLSFITKNRIENYVQSDYDIIIGPVANDNTMPTVLLYLEGAYDEDEAIKRLLTQKLKDQVVFKTEKSLEYLKFKEEIIL